MLGTSATPDLQLKALEIPGARMVKEIPDLHFRVYRFDTPLQPGQRAEIRFETVREQIGFRNNNNENRIVENGSFLTSHELTPVLGVHNLFALQERTARRRYGLPDEGGDVNEQVTPNEHQGTYLREMAELLDAKRPMAATEFPELARELRAAADRIEELPDRLLLYVAEEMAGMLREKEQVEQELKHLELIVAEHREREAILKNTLLTAQKAAEDIRENARKEAETIVKQADLQGDQQGAEGHREDARQEALPILPQNLDRVTHGGVQPLPGERASPTI